MRKWIRSLTIPLGAALFLAGLQTLAQAAPPFSDGVIPIDQAQALSGRVTPGDAPGFPVTITQSGSYRLTGNLKVPNANTSAIVITADRVTIDLNGFSITGPTTCTGIPVQSCTPTGTGSGIESSNASIVVYNGMIQGMGAHGVYLHGADKKYRVENVYVINNGSNGIYLFTSRGNTVTGNKAVLNGSRGIDAAFASVVTGNVADGNGEQGIVANHNSAVIGNIAVENGSFGLGMGDGAGYVNNVLTSNNGGSANPQLSGGVSLGENVCGSSLCP